jgi:CRISPR-associated protein Csb1
MSLALPTGPRLLVAASLAPVQGERFQPTGFPALGAATYRLADAEGTSMLLVESPQSMANRLEATMLEPGTVDPLPLFSGLPYVRVMRNGTPITSSLIEAHRINSPYILEGEDKSLREALVVALNVGGESAVDNRTLAQVLFRYDPSSLVHGVFLAKKDIAGGRFRLSRSLSAFIEARNVRPVASGGVKNDHVNPSGDTSSGFGNVPFAREEFTAGSVTAFFNVDLLQLRSYRLPEPATALLEAIALWKVQSLLAAPMRLRTACDLDVIATAVTRPAAYELPSLESLGTAIREGIVACTAAGLFSAPAVTEVQWTEGGSTKGKKGKADASTGAKS